MSKKHREEYREVKSFHKDNPYNKADGPSGERFKLMCRAHMKFLYQISEDKRFNLEYLKWVIRDAEKRNKIVEDIRAIIMEEKGEARDTSNRIVRYLERQNHIKYYGKYE